MLIADGERHNSRRQTIKTVVDKNMHGAACQVGQASSVINLIRDSSTRGSRDSSPIRGRDSTASASSSQGKTRFAEPAPERESEGPPPKAAGAAEAAAGASSD